jgi:hypothetical protein
MAQEGGSSGAEGEDGPDLADVLLPSDRLQRRVREGEITELRRSEPYAAEGDRFEIDGATFEVVAVERDRLGDLTEADARRMGAEDLDAYRERLRQVHPNYEWDADAETVCHRFERVD